MTDNISQKGLDILAERITEIFDLVSKKAPEYFIDHYRNGKLILDKGLPKYLAAQYHKCETIRTLLKRDSPTDLEKVYEPHRFKIDNDFLPEKDLHNKIGISLDRMIVSGRAGSGKSVFLKRLFRLSIEQGVTYYPVFFEFRNIKEGEYKNLKEELYKSILIFSEDFTRKQFEFGLGRGLFYIMLDALDECPSEIRESIEEDINEFSRKYFKCPVVITSRPIDTFSGWEGFNVAHLLPFDQEQCESFIKKVEFVEEKKEEFLSFIQGGAFGEHQEFLSNPLLASMMLLTFDEYGDIPKRQHVFYEKCFQVLIREHDSSKGKYRREFKSGLTHEVLEEVFTYFCVLSFLDKKIVFKKEDVIYYIDHAMQSVGVDVENQKICDDFVEAISILQIDGDYYEFSHRSFQEFFYARFTARDRNLPLIDKIAEIGRISWSDGPTDMIADMDRMYFEQDFLMPVASKITKKIKGIDVSASPDRLISKFFANFGVDKRLDFEADDKKSSKKTEVFISVDHNDEDYPQRHINLILYRYIKDYKDFKKFPKFGENMSDEEILSVFGLDELGENRHIVKINHHNREKMIKLGFGRYSVWLLEAMTTITENINKSIESKKSSIRERLLMKK